MKYIDAEKLYKQVDELMAHFAKAEKEAEPDTEDLSIFYQGKKEMCSELLGIIDSLQQEQDELTWKDLQKLDIIANKLWQDGKYDKNDAQEFYTEVLNEFNKIQEQKNK